jgi:hypothetical protein
LTDLTTVRQQGILAGRMLIGLLRGDAFDRAVTVAARR